MLKKIIAFLLVVSLTAAIAIGGTLAYLTDRDSEANVFTVGDVNIDLNEDFNQGATLVPGVDIEKKPTVTNVGPNEAWVWTTVAVPKNLASVIDFTGKGEGWKDWTTGSATINEEEYVLYTVLHTEALEVGKVTSAVFEKVTLDTTVDIDPNGQWHTVVNGTATDLGWNNSDGNPVIYVSAYAIQVEGFETVADAYAAYNTQWGTNGTEFGTPATTTFTTVSTADQLKAALAEGGNIVLTADVKLDRNEVINVPKGNTATMNLNGHTLSGTSNATDKNSNLITVKGNLTIDNGTVAMEYTGENQGWNRAVSVFSVEGGELTLGSGVIVENKGGSDMAYGVDVNSTGGETVLNIDGATIKSTYVAVRLFNNNKTQQVVVNMNSGLVDGASRDIWVHNPSAAAVDENAIVNIAESYTYDMTVQTTSFNGRIYNFT